jgi:DNA polymerase III subunit delta
MTAVKSGDVENALRRLSPATVAVLFYGPDAGLAAERAKATAERAVDDPSDPFQFIKLDGDALVGDTARLVDEAGTMGLFGARRAIWVRPASRNIAPAVAPVLEMPLQDTLVVVEAGDLAKSSPLRLLFERSPRALAMPCYADEGRSLDAVVDEALRRAGLSIARDARAALLAGLGGDRIATRSEIAKLALYAHGQREITIEDVDAVMSDVSSLALDEVLDAAFTGDRPRLDRGYRRLAAEGASASTILGGALRHAYALIAGRGEMDAGRSLQDAWKSFRSNFRREAALKQQLQAWTVVALCRVVEKLQTAVLESRRRAEIAEAVAAQALFESAGLAQRRDPVSRSSGPERSVEPGSKLPSPAPWVPDSR